MVDIDPLSGLLRQRHFFYLLLLLLGGKGWVLLVDEFLLYLKKGENKAIKAV